MMEKGRWDWKPVAGQVTKLQRGVDVLEVSNGRGPEVEVGKLACGHVLQEQPTRGRERGSGVRVMTMGGGAGIEGRPVT